MQNDILTFASRTLVTDGRLCMWMPTSNDEVELVIPMHPNLEIVSVSVQPFNNCMSFFPLGVVNYSADFFRVPSAYYVPPFARRTSL